LHFVKDFLQRRLLYFAEYIERYFDKPWTLWRIIFLCFKLLTLFTFIWFGFVLICNLLSFFIKSFFFFLELYYDSKKIKNNLRLKPWKIFNFLNYIADFKWYMFKYEYRDFKHICIYRFTNYIRWKFKNFMSFIASRPLYYQVSKMRLKKLYRKIRYFFLKGALKREFRRFIFKCKIIFIWIQKLCGFMRLRIIFNIYNLKWKFQWFYCWIFLKCGEVYLFFCYYIYLVKYYSYSFWIDFSFWFWELAYFLGWIFAPLMFCYKHLIRIFKSSKKVIIDKDLDMIYIKPKDKKKLTPEELKKFKEHLNLDKKRGIIK